MERVFKKMEKELISIIIPIYNVEKYLPKCIENVINQSYKNLEIILIDDGSTDSSGKICDEYKKIDSRIKVIHKKNGGVSSARNIGLDEASGNWISFVDADDWLEKDFCKLLLENILKEQVDIGICSYNRIVSNNIEIINFHRNEIIDSRNFLNNCLNPQSGFGTCIMKIYNRLLIDKLRFDENLKVAEDALFNIEMSKNIEKILILNKALYNYRINLESTVKKFDENYVKKYKFAMEINKNYILNQYTNDEKIIEEFNNFVAFHVMLIAVNYCFHPENKEKNKIKLLKKVCNIEIFKEGISNSNYKSFSITRKITLFTLKYKLYYLTKLICIFRQKQNRK